MVACNIPFIKSISLGFSWEKISFCQFNPYKSRVLIQSNCWILHLLCILRVVEVDRDSVLRQELVQVHVLKIKVWAILIVSWLLPYVGTKESWVIVLYWTISKLSTLLQGIRTTACKGNNTKLGISTWGIYFLCLYSIFKTRLKDKSITIQGKKIPLVLPSCQWFWMQGQYLFWNLKSIFVFSLFLLFFNLICRTSKFTIEYRVKWIHSCQHTDMQIYIETFVQSSCCLN